MPIALDEVDPTPLDKMPRKSLSVSRALEVQMAKSWSISESSRAKCFLVARMRRGGQHDDPPLRVLREPLQQLETLLLAFVGAHTSVGFVNDHEVGTGPREPLPALLGLDVIEADNRVGVGVEEGLSER